MDKDLSKLWHYLTHEQVSALDVLLLSIVGSFFTWILAMLGRFLGRLLLRTIRSIRNYLMKLYREFHRRYISKRVTMNEYIIIKDKLEKGQKLKRYEEKKYASWNKGLQRLRDKGKIPETPQAVKDILEKFEEKDETFKG